MGLCTSHRLHLESSLSGLLSGKKLKRRTHNDDAAEKIIAVRRRTYFALFAFFAVGRRHGLLGDGGLARHSHCRGTSFASFAFFAVWCQRRPLGAWGFARHSGSRGTFFASFAFFAVGAMAAKRRKSPLDRMLSRYEECSACSDALSLAVPDTQVRLACEARLVPGVGEDGNHAR